MKLLNKKAFMLIMCGIVASLIYSVVNTLISILGEPVDYSQFAALGDDFVELVKQIAVGITIAVTVIIALIYAYFIIRLLKNRKAEAPQGYLKFLFVINVIGIILNIFSLIGGDFLVLISIVINAFIIYGCIIQKKSNNNN